MIKKGDKVRINAANTIFHGDTGTIIKLEHDIDTLLSAATVAIDIKPPMSIIFGTWMLQKLEE